MKRVNSHGKCYNAEVSGKEGQIGRMPFLMEIRVTPVLSTRFHLLKIWKQIVQRFLNIFQKIAFVLSVNLEEFQFLFTQLPSLHIHTLSPHLLLCCNCCEEYVLFTFHLNCKYHPWELIDDMQMSILYKRKHWHSLSHSLHFVSDMKGDWQPTRPPQQGIIKPCSRLPIFNSVYLGLVPGHIDSPYLIIMS